MSTARSTHAPKDEARLRQLGYRPELARRMGPFGNFALSFSIISAPVRLHDPLWLRADHRRPAVMLWGWLFVGLLVLAVGAALAEVTSAYPVSGALYFMASKPGGPRWGYVTGWFNLLGLLGGMADGCYGTARFTGAWLNLQFDFAPTPGRTLAIFAVILLLLATLNLFGVRLVAVLNSISC